MHHFPAPWSRSLIVVTAVVTTACLGTSALNWPALAELQATTMGFWLAVAPLAVIGSGALFVVRGYSITPHDVLVHRLLWATRLPRTGLERARLVPHALTVGTRTFGGNGGFFSCCGFLLSRDLGVLRAFVTDPARAVELRFARRIVVVSPDDPARFVAALAARADEGAPRCAGRAAEKSAC